MGHQELIRMEHVSKTYSNQKEVLKDINLKVDAGDFITIMGKSGCGKSTLLNMIGLLDRITSGEYYYRRSLVAKPAFGALTQIRANEIGFIFQSYCLLENLSISDNILLPLLYNDIKLNGVLLENLDHYLSIFGLAEDRNKKVKLLSGGEKQRVAIIRALIKAPSLIVADEPTGNLDPENSAVICKELVKLSEMGKAVVVVTHNKDVFRDAGRLYFLQEGVLTADA